MNTNMIEITTDAIAYMMDDIGMELYEEDNNGHSSLTFVGDSREYKTYDDIVGLLDSSGYTGMIACEPYIVIIGDELVY